MRSLHRNLLVLLRARNGEGFEAAVIGREEAEGRTVDRLQVEFGGVTSVLDVDVESGQVLRMTYQEANPMTRATSRTTPLAPKVPKVMMWETASSPYFLRT